MKTFRWPSPRNNPANSAGEDQCAANALTPPPGTLSRGSHLVDGNHVLYHYLQKDLLISDIWLFQMLVARLITDLGIWIHPDTYSSIPVLLPHVIRDASCRKSAGGEEEWGAPDESGHFRDDNSLIKAIGKQLTVSSSASHIYSNRKLGAGFTACHVWRKAERTNQLASRLPTLNSFVPNLVWLPNQVAKLTDREGSFAQSYLQALSWKIYRDMRIEGSRAKYVAEAWSFLRRPEVIPEDGLPASDKLSFFEHSPRFVENRIKKLELVVGLLEMSILGSAPGTSHRVV